MQQPRTRDVLAGFPPYRPGRSPADVARDYGIARVVKLASNENAHPPLPGVIERAAESLTAMNRYPDNAATALRERLGEWLDVDPLRVVPGCGSVALCQQLVQSTCDAGDDVAYCWRSFEAYPIFTAVAGARSVQGPLDAQTFDLRALAAALTPQTRLVFLCNPNNPTGTAVGREALVEFLDAVPSDVLVVYDEAYREYVSDPDVPDGMELARSYPNVAVLRTFSKAYGLAGMRVGYCVAPLAVADTLRTTHVPFSVSTVAQAAALASLEPWAQAELEERVTEVVGERARVTEKLRGMGLDVPSSQTNFVWLALGDDAVPFAAAAERRGAIVRPFDGDGVRVTIGTPDENDAFLAIVEDALAETSEREETRPAPVLASPAEIRD